MNYRDKIRKAIECPQFGNGHYGEWGALRLDQRRYIKRLLDELDSADAYILKLYEEAQKQKEAIDKAIKILEKGITFCKNDSQGIFDICNVSIAREERVLNILKEVENKEDLKKFISD